MDPKHCLLNALACLEVLACQAADHATNRSVSDADTTQAILDLESDLGEYARWRAKGGFEPSFGGNELAKILGDILNRLPRRKD